ncbi:MAG: cytochrome c4 [Deltaproteobacteria bacterium]|nr:MAG: cytochrome c4 [Deltaproteobacteria bacterium]
MRVAVLAALFVSFFPGGLASQVDISSQQIEAGKKKAEYCAGCHGADGNSEQTDYPILAGQTTRYNYLQLKDYKSGRRKDEMMNPVAAQLEKQDMVELAAYYAVQRPKGPRIQSGESSVPFRPDPARVIAGRSKSAEVLCTMCHLGEFSGQNEVPRVAGQHPAYVIKQLKEFKNGTRTNDAGTMSSVAKTLSDEDIVNLAHYLASL